MKQAWRAPGTVGASACTSCCYTWNSDTRLPVSRWSHRETHSESPHPGEHPGSTPWMLGKSKEGFCFWQLLEESLRL